jgi:hypothetical protein
MIDEMSAAKTGALGGVLGVAAPLAIVLTMGGRSESVIAGIRSWLTANNDVIMATIFVLLGVNFAGQGLAVVG